MQVHATNPSNAIASVHNSYHPVLLHTPGRYRSIKRFNLFPVLPLSPKIEAKHKFRRHTLAYAVHEEGSGSFSELRRRANEVDELLGLQTLLLAVRCLRCQMVFSVGMFPMSAV